MLSLPLSPVGVMPALLVIPTIHQILADWRDWMLHRLGWGEAARAAERHPHPHPIGGHPVPEAGD